MTRAQFRTLMLLTIVAGFLGGAVSHLLLRGAPALAQEEEAVLQEVRARGFVLVDEQGRARAELGLRDGEPALRLRDEAGNPRAGLSLVGGGEPGLWLWDEAGKGGAWLHLVDGEPDLSLWDEAGETRAFMGLAEGKPVLMLTDETGRVLWQAP